MENKHLLKNAMSFKKYIAILLLFLGVFSIPLYAARTYSGTERVYLKADAVSWWRDGNAKIGIYFSGGTGTATFVEATVFSGVVWSALAPAGNYDKITVTRHSGSPITWDNDWNKTGDIVISETSTHNYISVFAENSTAATWGSYVLSAPTANAASSISSTGFTANWTAVTGNEGYRLDVSTNNTFTGNLTGYTNLTVTGTSQVVTGLTEGTNYYYRVRTFNAGGSSGQSNTITATTSAARTYSGTERVYLKANAVSWWTNNSAKIGLYFFGGTGTATFVEATVFSGDVWSALAPAGNFTHVNVTRHSASPITWDNDWNKTGDIPISTTSTNNYISAFAENSATATWGSYVLSAPTANAASSISSTGFTANWTAVTGNEGYRLDVSTNNTFTENLTGYTNLTVTGTSQVVTGLTGGTNYYYRVRTFNAGGSSGQSNTITATTTAASTAPSITSSAATSVGNGTGTMNGNISSNGGNSIDDYGFYWSMTNGFADGDGTKVQVGTSNYTGAVSSALSSLTNGTTYYYKAYAHNSVGTTYGTQQSFTPSTTPSVTSSAATSVGSGTGTMNGEVTATGGSTVTARGFYYSTTSGNTNGTGGTAVAVGSGTGTFSSALTSLTNGTTYYYKAYATNANGTVYSTTEQSFTPSAIATVTSSAATSVSSGTGTMNGNVTADGGNTVTERGFYYSTTSGNTNGTGGTAVTAGSGTGAFSSTLTSLTNGTTYYYKAYATNANGTVYSSTEQSFTPCSAPVSYAQSVTITACGSKTIDLTAGLTGSIPGDAGTVTYTVSPVGDGLTISGSTATFSATANKTYTITISYSNAAYCSVSGTLSVTYTNNTPSISLTNTKTGKSASATYPYEAFVLTATTSNTPVTWTLTQPSGVTDGTLTISADTKTATFVGGTSNASPYTIEAATVAVGSCSAASVQYSVYVDAPEAENCTAPTNCTSTWAYRFDSDANDGSWNSFTDFTCTGTNKWTCKFVLPGSKYNWNFKIFHSSDSGGNYSQIQYQFNNKGITYYSGDKTWTIVLTEGATEGATAGAYTFVISEGDHTSTGGSTPTNPTVLRGAAASVNTGTSQATLYGYLKFTGCSTITSYGFQYANNASFTGATSVTTTGSLTAASTYNKIVDVSGLSVGTYYYRAYATNAKGTDYSDSATFVIANLKPALTTTAATSIGKTSGTMNGNISSNGGSSITDYGFYYSETSGFANGAGTKVQKGTSDYTGNISHQLTGLTTGTTYYYKAYAHNSVGTTYGTQQSFTPCSAPVSYAQSVTITACGSKTIDLTAGLTGSIPGDAGTVTYSVVGDATGLSIDGSNATFSGSASKDYLIQVEFSAGDYCAVKGTLSVSYTNNTPALGFTNTLTPSGLSYVTYPYEDFVLEATTLVPSNATITWSLIRTGVTGGEITVSPNGKSVTFVTDQLASSPNKYTIRGTIPGVGTCAGVTADWDVYVNSESCAAANSSTVVRITDPGNTYQNVGWNGSAYVYVWYNKAVGGALTEPLGAWPGTWTSVSNGYSSITIDAATFADAQSGTVNVQFRSRYDYSGNTGKTTSIPVTSGKIYTVSLTGSYTGSGTDRVFAHSVSSTANASAPIVSRGFAPHFNANELTLHGYVQCKNGADVTAHGFQYATNAAFTNAVTVSNTPGTINEATAFSSIVNVADLNCTTTYYYRAYATNGGGTAYSDASTFYVPESKYCIDCGSFEGDTITFTIDSNFASDNDCALYYRSLEGAITKLKATPDFYDAATTELKKFIIMNVVPRTTPYAGTANPSFSGGGDKMGSYTVHMIKDINNLDAVDYQYMYNGTVPRTLTIQSASATVKPSIKSVIVRKSKNVILKDLILLGTTTSNGQESNAMDIDNGSREWITGSAGRYKDGNILVENCYITSKGFTCIHVSAYDGVTFRNNEIEAKLTNAELGEENTQKWGASAKFIRTTDILFERNNFRGDHATLVWLQESKNVLFMNNVFWSTNNVNAQQAFIKLLSQEGDNTVENNAFYYNTLFLNNGSSTNTQTDFFRLGRETKDQNGNTAKYIASSIAFEYNNCYSYAPTVTGRRSDTFLNRTPAEFTLLKNNNFWSINEGTSSDGLEFGTGARNIHVKQELCSTAPNDPMGLVVKGEDLNVGSALKTDITGLGAMSIHRNDRLRTTIRPAEGTGWTLGAYQQTDGIDVDTIIWTGAFDSDWDNRNNWIDAATRQTLSCVHQLSANLVVIIPSYTGSEIYQSPTGQIENEPILPAQFASDRPIKLDNEHVDAGAGLTSVTPTQFARKIDIEYGGSLLNAHKLKPGEARLYDEVTMHLDLDNRKEWVLVGPVVQPFTDGTKTAVRQLQSGDFFLNFEPHVYMNYVNIDTSTGAVTWAAPFTQLTEPVGPQQIFAIWVPNQYGNVRPYFKVPSSIYYRNGTAEQKALGSAPIKYTFNGRLSDEAGLRQYTIESKHQILSNTFPANLDAAKVAAAGGTVQIWNYDFKSFQPAIPGNMIKPMHGFIYSRSTEGQTSLQVTDAMIVFGNTKYRKRTVTQPLFLMSVNNTNNTYGSVINVKYDADKADTFDGMIDSEKLFNDQDLNVPEMYMMAYSKKLSQKGINKQTETIPLGIRTNVEKSLKFKRYYNDGYEEVILEDRHTGTTYDMLATNAEYIINNVPSGNNEGRFYLHLTVAEDRIPSTIGEETIGSADAEELDIAIFAQGKQVTVSSSQNLVIETILVSDMAGRTQVFTATNPHFNQLNLQVAQGTYIVKVIGDKGTKEAKVIIK